MKKIIAIGFASLFAHGVLAQSEYLDKYWEDMYEYRTLYDSSSLYPPRDEFFERWQQQLQEQNRQEEMRQMYRRELEEHRRQIERDRINRCLLRGRSDCY